MTPSVDLVTLGEPMGLVRGTGVGPLRVGSPATVSFAGAECNVAIGMARLGHRAAYVGRVGDDLTGRIILDAVRAEGVDTANLAVDPEAPTGVMVREHRTADRLVASYARAGSAGSRLCPADVDEGLVRGARILHLTGITPALSATAHDAVLHALRLARDAELLVSLDVNHRSLLWSTERARSVLGALLPEVDLLFGGAEELTLLADGADPARLATELAAAGPREVVVKRGAAGAIAVVAGRAYDQPALAVTAVDPVGAGDAFVAGYLSALLDGGDVPGRLRRGAVCGAFAVSVPGDWEGLPHRRELHLLEGEENVHR